MSGTLRTRSAQAAVTVTATGVATLAYASLIERRWYRLRRITLPGVLRRPGRLAVLHVSDLHLVPGQRHRVAFLERLGRLDHDLTVVTGDLLGAPGSEDAVADALAPLVGPERPGLVVLGSNDYFGPVVKAPWRYLTDPGHRTHGPRLKTGRLVERLADRGYRTLIDRTEVVQTVPGPVSVAGLDDPHLPWTQLPDPSAIRPPGPDALLHLGLVHSPYLDALDTLVDADYDLLLAGHTHGGQVRIPGIGAVVDNCDLPLDLARGASRYRDRWLHVSAGLGHSRYAPVRFACPPEATLLELTG